VEFDKSLQQIVFATLHAESSIHFLQGQRHAYLFSPELPLPLRLPLVVHPLPLVPQPLVPQPLVVHPLPLVPQPLVPQPLVVHPLPQPLRLPLVVHPLPLVPQPLVVHPLPQPLVPQPSSLGATWVGNNEGQDDYSDLLD
jgi:hypothetical protein